MSIIIYALGVITGILIAFMVELFARKPSERNQPLAKLFPSQKGVIIENNPIINSFIDYDPARDEEVESL